MSMDVLGMLMRALLFVGSDSDELPETRNNPNSVSRLRHIPYAYYWRLALY